MTKEITVTTIPIVKWTAPVSENRLVKMSAQLAKVKPSTRFEL